MNFLLLTYAFYLSPDVRKVLILADINFFSLHSVLRVATDGAVFAAIPICHETEFTRFLSNHCCVNTILLTVFSKGGETF